MGAVFDFQDVRLVCWLIGLSSTSRKSSAHYIGMHLLTDYLHIHITLVF